jgi:hypothetical protein
MKEYLVMFSVLALAGTNLMQSKYIDDLRTDVTMQHEILKTIAQGDVLSLEMMKDLNDRMVRLEIIKKQGI